MIYCVQFLLLNVSVEELAIWANPGESGGVNLEDESLIEKPLCFEALWRDKDWIHHV